MLVVDTAKLATPAMQACYERKSYRIGIRHVLDALGIEHPDGVKRKPAGRPRTAAGSKMTRWRDKQRVAAALHGLPTVP